ncbi:MAG: T9SS type A sorting domain-containing protein [Bacteroidales bacterium]|nr:T9SS type A sorting domain-containing protein [Bacteroidales bacterium]
MKQIFTITLISFLAIQVFAQNEIILKDLEGNVVNGQTISVNANINDDYESAIAYFSVTNNTSSALEIKVSKEIISAVPNTYNDFCWAGGCYPNNVHVSNGSLVLEANETTVGDDLFSAKYHCMGIEGETTIKYNLFDVNSDIQAWFSVKFIASQTSIPSNLIGNFVYPNPAKDFFYVDINQFNAKNLKMEVFNVIGSKVYEMRIDGEGKQTIDCSEWKKGMYILRFYSEGNLIKSLKLSKK